MLEKPTLYDNHGRPVNYLRLAVTDRCNLRCFYCMPSEGINYIPKSELLTYEEMERIVSVLSELGITKLRITGGEPFVRKDLIPFLEKLSKIEGLEQINITTNGILTAQYLDDLERLGITTVNLSLDTLNEKRFFEITRRNQFKIVENTLNLLTERNFKVKINTVVMEGKNEEDILDLVNLSKDRNIETRFIEEMPFNGEGARFGKITWNHKRILQEIQQFHPEIKNIPAPPHNTANLYEIPGFKSNIGIIPAYTRTFCGSCNRIRMTAQGLLKTCLYDSGVLDVRELIRSGANNDELKNAFKTAFNTRAKDGFEAEKNRSGSQVSESMSTIGG
ncbi:MAG: GTP 3',8-cyclase MoaA [Cyclobacteriaceae bacterium]|nr:GTP 3',8-cyclase MoaA [Cyclobacteriaceae bacterium]